MNILTGLTGAFKAVGNVVDELHTSQEEKLTLKNKFAELQANTMGGLIDYQGKLNNAQAKVITAEATGSSGLQRMWRPITMLTFVGLIVARWLGFTTDNITPELELELFSIIKIGLGGYVAGRSLEKIAKGTAQVMSNYTK